MEKEDFEKLLGAFLKDRFPLFWKAVDKKPSKGAVYPADLLSFEAFEESLPEATYVCPSYFSYPYGTKVFDNPLYFAGGFYPMDYSSFSVSRSLAHALKGVSRPKVLDLCAAPGGKTIALRSLIDLELAVANDISPSRSEVLRLNVERSGRADIAVTRSEPIAFLKDFTGYFDAVILDAPCSGSGMARKKEKMAEDWSWEKVERLAPLQRELIAIAYSLLREGGILSYSTCSYAREENEDVVSFLLQETKGELLPSLDDGSLPGFEGIGKRYIPGLFPGEGQYHALIRKAEPTPPNPLVLPRQIKEDPDYAPYRQISFRGRRHLFETVDARLLSLHPIKLGWAIEEPSSHAKCPFDWDFSHAPFFPSLELSLSEAKSYLRGEDLRRPTAPWEGKLAVATYQKRPLGFAKGIQNRVRNYLPKGLRIR